MTEYANVNAASGSIYGPIRVNANAIAIELIKNLASHHPLGAKIDISHPLSHSHTAYHMSHTWNLTFNAVLVRVMVFRNPNYNINRRVGLL